jgi:hypothetical protein
MVSGIESSVCEDSNPVSKTTTKCLKGFFKKFASTRVQSRVLACFLERRRLVVVA